MEKCKFNRAYICDAYSKDKCLKCPIRLKARQTSITAWCG